MTSRVKNIQVPKKFKSKIISHPLGSITDTGLKYKFISKLFCFKIFAFASPLLDSFPSTLNTMKKVSMKRFVDFIISRYVFNFLDLHSCKPNPCLNNGLCREIDGKGKFECQCTEQFRGSICNSEYINLP